MNLGENLEKVKMELQIAPLIDVVFLLLIYFMVTATLIRQEGDLQFILPAKMSGPPPIDLPVEAVIEIGAEGTVTLEGMQFAAADERLGAMVQQIRGLKALAQSQNAEFFVNILPHRDTLHRRVVDVMDACAEAKVESLTFSQSN